MAVKKSNWFWGVILLVLGIFMLANPNAFAKFVVTIFGLVVIARSIYNIIDTEKNFKDVTYKNMALIKAIVGIVFGIITVVFALPFAKAAWTAISYVFAVFLIVSAFFGFYTLSLIRDSDVDRKNYIFENVILLAAAILIFLITPAKLAELIIRVIGLVVLLVGVIFLAIEIIKLVRASRGEIVLDRKDVKVQDYDDDKDSDDDADDEDESDSDDSNESDKKIESDEKSESDE